MKNITFTIVVLLLLISPVIAAGQIAPLSTKQGGTGTTTAPTLGQVLVGRANGTYGPVSTSSLGISGGAGSSLWEFVGGALRPLTAYWGVPISVANLISTSSAPSSFVGSVGIGTTSAGNELEVVSGDGISAIRLTETTGADSQWELRSHNATPSSGLTIWGGVIGSETTPFTISSAGNVGIATTSPASKIHIESTSEQLRLGHNGNAYASFTADSSGNINVNPTGRNFNVYTGGADAAIIVGRAVSERMRIVVDDGHTFFTASQDETDGTSHGVYFNIVSSSTGRHDYVWQRAGIDKMLFNSDFGFLGIGTSSPSAHLTVSGDMRLTGRFADSSSSTGTVGSVLTATANGTAWVATSSLGIAGGGGGGSGTVNSGNTGELAWYAATGTEVTATSSLAIRLVDSIWTFFVNMARTIFSGDVTILGKTQLATSTYYGATSSAALFIDGIMNEGTWVRENCTTPTAEVTQVAADTLRGCGRYAYLEDANGVIDFVAPTTGSTTYFRLRPGALGTVTAAGDGMGIGWASGIDFGDIQRNRVMFEFGIKQDAIANATSTVVVAGITDKLGVSTDFATEPAQGVYIIATSTTANWLVACNPSTGGTTYINTGIASSSFPSGNLNPFTYFLGEIPVTSVSNTAVQFIIKARTQANNVYTEVANCTMNLSASTQLVAPTAGIGKSTAGSASELHVSWLKFGYNQPSF